MLRFRAAENLCVGMPLGGGMPNRFEQVASKVPAVTLGFWIVEILRRLWAKPEAIR